MRAAGFTGGPPLHRPYVSPAGVWGAGEPRRPDVVDQGVHLMEVDLGVRERRHDPQPKPDLRPHDRPRGQLQQRRPEPALAALVALVAVLGVYDLTERLLLRFDHHRPADRL